MIVSHQYKYVFVELPRTGTTSIRSVLVEELAGESVLYRHAPLSLFLKNATKAERSYFVFACVRNPLDRAYSLYVKLKTDQRQYFTKLENQPGWSYAKWHHLRRFHDIRDNNLSFPDYFQKYYRMPYVDLLTRDLRHCDHIVHFENLSAEFQTALQKLDVDRRIELPLKNKTQRASSFWECYPEPIRERARWVFADSMRRYGYEFPADWPELKGRRMNRALIGLMGRLKTFYWHHVLR